MKEKIHNLYNFVCCFEKDAHFLLNKYLQHTLFIIVWKFLQKA